MKVSRAYCIDQNKKKSEQCLETGKQLQDVVRLPIAVIAFVSDNCDNESSIVLKKDHFASFNHNWKSFLV